MRNLLVRLWNEEEGQDLTEYALLLVLLARRPQPSALWPPLSLAHARRIFL